MTVRTRAQINSDADTLLPDNTSAEISPADLRGRIKDLADSAAFSAELATVATSGAYNDLSGKPALGSAAALSAGTAAGNVPVLDSGGKIAAAVLPSYVDDVLEFANLAAFPATGESGKIYIAIDSNFQYRWGGSSYTQITASPGSTDSIAEGSTNLYFTEARVRAAVLTGLSLVTGTAIAATDTVLSAFGKLQKQITDLSSSVATILGWARREVLSADRTYYVRTDGADTNNGLANSAGGAFLTIQKAINTALGLDMSIYGVTINIGAGTFAEGSFLSIQGNGNARITLQGASYTTTTISGSTYGVLATGSLSLTILNLNITGSAIGLWARYGAQVFLAGNMAFGAASARLIGCDNSAYIECVGSGNNIYLAGNSTYAIFVGSLGHVFVGSSAKMLTTAARTFTATVSATNGGVLEMQGATFDVTAGAVTGSRYAAANGGIINTGGGGASFVPGSTAGTGTNPGATPYGLYI